MARRDKDIDNDLTPERSNGIGRARIEKVETSQEGSTHN